LSLLRRPPGAPLFPYTTLFRSRRAGVREAKVRLPVRSILLHRPLALHRASVIGDRDAEALGELRRVARPREAVRAERYVVPASKDRKSTRLNSSHVKISYAVFC